MTGVRGKGGRQRGRGRGKGRGRRGENEATEETAAGFDTHLTSDNPLVSPSTCSRAAIAPSSTLPSALRGPVRCVYKTPEFQAESGGANPGIPVTGKTTIQVPTNFDESGKGKIAKADSTNITEFARNLQNEQEQDPDEIQSTLDPAFDYINGHKVKKGISPLLKSIFETHGDITTASETKSCNLRSFYLERVCDIYTALEKTSFCKVSVAELDEMLVEVLDLGRQKVNVGWLREKIEYVRRTKIDLHGYPSVKDEAKINEAFIGRLEKEIQVCRREVEEYEKDISVLRHKISLREKRILEAEKELVVKKAKVDHNTQMVVDIKKRFISLKNQSLVGGLLKSHEAQLYSF